MGSLGRLASPGLAAGYAKLQTVPVPDPMARCQQWWSREFPCLFERGEAARTDEGLCLCVYR